MNTGRIDHQDIRIGTLVGGNARSAATIAQILPHGFESFEITFWQELGDCDVGALARDVRKTLEGSGAVISELRQQNWRGTIDIEGWHDPVYAKDLEMTGQVYALNHLKACRGGPYVANPTP